MTNIENEIIEEFELFDNWEDKYQYLIDLGKELKGLEDEFEELKLWCEWACYS